MRFLFVLMMIFIFVLQVLSTEITTDDERTIVYDPNASPEHEKEPDYLYVGKYISGNLQETYRAAATYDFSEIPGWHVVTDGDIDLNVSVPYDDFKLFFTTVGNQYPPSRTNPQLYDDIEEDELNSGLLIQTGYSNSLDLNTAMKEHFDSFVECEAGYAPLGFKSGEGISETNSFAVITQTLDLTCSAVMSTSGELSGNERWGGDHELDGNITVSLGDTLTLWEGLDLDLNGYYIKSTGGTIEEKSSVDFAPCKIVAQSGGSIQGYYSSLASAHSNTSTGSTIYVNSSHTLTGNVDADYKTVRLEGGTLSLSSYELTSGNYGSIVIDGGIVSPISNVKTVLAQ